MQPRAPARRALDRDPPVERADAVGEPAKAGAGRDVGAAHPVVGDLDHDRVGRPPPVDRTVASTRCAYFATLVSPSATTK